ncbi:Trp biosynthesis-associated membrane protein [Nocardioides sp.]|uniref:Trp biosynthesis-associated membrane protein n=1 Tax=Nocardioides sp. TaxID=35761 RepID=UPI003566DC27
MPVTALGVGATVAAVVASARPWAASEAVSSLVDGAEPGLTSSLSLTLESGRVPLANALALVALACWGVLLVARGRARRLVTGLGALASVGLLITTVVAFSAAPARVRDSAVDLPVSPGEVALTGWYWVGLAAAVVVALAWLLAALWVPRWPEMGRRYDAPRPSAARREDPASDSSLDLWKAIDDGRDPTS